MRKLTVLMAIIVAMFMVAGLAYADNEDPNKDVQQTSRGNYTTPHPGLTSWLNDNPDFYHSHDIYIPTRRALALGIGADVVCYQGSGLVEEVTMEGKYDWQNDEGSIYAVSRINAFKAIKGLFE